MNVLKGIRVPPREFNQVEFLVTGHSALFTDPLSRIGSEKCSYPIPTYEALKGILKAVYWKPTITWVIDRVRIMNAIRMQAKGVKPLDFAKGEHSLAYYTYLVDVAYQVRAHFEWNLFREDMAADRNENKHFTVALRMIERGGRRQPYLGTSECWADVEPCTYGEGKGYYDEAGETAYGLMFHGFDYPDETGRNELRSRFWHPKMENGEVVFVRPEECAITKVVREMTPCPPRSSGLNDPGLVSVVGG